MFVSQTDVQPAVVDVVGVAARRQNDNISAVSAVNVTTTHHVACPRHWVYTYTGVFHMHRCVTVCTGVFCICRCVSCECVHMQVCFTCMSVSQERVYGCALHAQVCQRCECTYRCVTGMIVHINKCVLNAWVCHRCECKHKHRCGFSLSVIDQMKFAVITRIVTLVSHYSLDS